MIEVTRNLRIGDDVIVVTGGVTPSVRRAVVEKFEHKNGLLLVWVRNLDGSLAWEEPNFVIATEIAF